ncbi:hypothetical protein [Roseovarius ramblicola]|uniref:Uncharacterized protein n=1 Tax=Roseovarius ramblicola TaxID=2022336 RepID=A0ABV5I363_9RHOB
MPQDICLTPASRTGRVPRFTVTLGLAALLMAVIVSGQTPEPHNVEGAEPAYEDWHGNVRRSR